MRVTWGALGDTGRDRGGNEAGHQVRLAYGELTHGFLLLDFAQQRF